MEQLDNVRRRIISVNRLFLVTLILYVTGSLLTADIQMSMAASLILSQALIVIPSIVWLSMKKIPLRSFLRLKKMDFATVLLVLLFAFLMYPLLSFINVVSMQFLEYNISDTLSESSQQLPFAVMFLLVAVVPSCVEELVYRGVIFHTYRKHSLLKGALLSGLLFGMMHANFNQFFYAFVLGVIFSFLVEATGSLFSTMLVHLCYNGFSVCVLYLLQYLRRESEAFAKMYEQAESTSTAMGTEEILSLLPFTLISSLLAFFVFRAIARRNNKFELIFHMGLKRENWGKFRRLISVPLILAMLGLLYLMVVNELLAMGIIQ